MSNGNRPAVPIQSVPMKTTTAIVLLVLPAAHVVAQPTPSYGLDFATIGAPGNAPASPSDFVFLNPIVGPVGRVDYTFRLARTELTVSQWVEFVTAYANVNDAVYNDPDFMGGWIFSTGGTPGNRTYDTLPGSSNAPASVSWNFATRYCNWLHNGKVNEAWAFERGAYDTSTISFDGQWHGPLTHAPDAKFWIPTIDEWTKGMHYDPNRRGPGVGGYWLYPTSSDTPPVSGLPGTPGAQTGAGDYVNDPNNPERLYPVGSYPTAASPWGLLDGSGGLSEWLECLNNAADARPWRGSSNRFTSSDFSDRLDYFDLLGPGYTAWGLRLASSVPAPAASLALTSLGLGAACLRRRGRA